MRPVTIYNGEVVVEERGANYVHSRPLTDEEAVAHFRANPALQTTGWEAHLLRRLATVEAERDREAMLRDVYRRIEEAMSRAPSTGGTP